jgi:hypothetical protein
MRDDFAVPEILGKSSGDEALPDTSFALRAQSALARSPEALGARDASRRLWRFRKSPE